MKLRSQLREPVIIYHCHKFYLSIQNRPPVSGITPIAPELLWNADILSLPVFPVPYSETEIFPPADDIFNAFHLTPLSQVKVVILGQDPYHNVGQAHGLCFSVRPEVDIPPSLVNIYKELHDDLGCKIPNNGYLIKWAEQGVLMLNTVLTADSLQILDLPVDWFHAVFFEKTVRLAERFAAKETVVSR